MRPTFFAALYEQMSKNQDIWALCGDLGFGGFDRIRQDFPKRFINCRVGEQAMIDVAIGLAMSGKIPFVYSITPFLLYRPFESIRNYINYEKVPVRLVASGRDKDYGDLGFSHWACEDRDVMQIFSNMTAFWPEDKNEVPNLVDQMVKVSAPYYLNLCRR